MQSSRNIFPAICRIAKHRSFIQKSLVTSLRCNSADAAQIIPEPAFDGSERNYSSKITTLVGEISNLTLLEVKDLNDLLKKELNISEIQTVAAAAPVSSGVTEEATPVQEQQDFTIKLTDFNKSDKIKVIKCVKTLIPDLNLTKAKALVENLPQIVKKDGSKEEVEEMKKQLEAVGGIVTVE